ncbi:hypothetical protein FKP32DRAFT_946611 [Trametes sanguinea]|nr:hypothetical protein FKP32DRAFT_946611 [Trametes sanguinea]
MLSSVLIAISAANMTFDGNFPVILLLAETYPTALRSHRQTLATTSSGRPEVLTDTLSAGRCNAGRPPSGCPDGGRLQYFPGRFLEPGVTGQLCAICTVETCLASTLQARCLHFMPYLHASTSGLQSDKAKAHACLSAVATVLLLSNFFDTGSASYMLAVRTILRPGLC